jgi:hypothetical protein
MQAHPEQKVQLRRFIKKSLSVADLSVGNGQ